MVAAEAQILSQCVESIETCHQGQGVGRQNSWLFVFSVTLLAASRLNHLWGEDKDEHCEATVFNSLRQQHMYPHPARGVLPGERHFTLCSPCPQSLCLLRKMGE